MPSILEFVLYAIYAGILLYVSWTDIRTRRIPNVVIGPAILLALLAMHWTIGITPALLGGIIAPLPLIVARLIAGAGKMGMGDIKMAIFVGLILGSDFALVGVVIGLVLSLIVGLIGILRGKWTLQSKLPFGPFLAAGTLPLLALLLV
ncbi:MAG TPA: A24 family peptidase [Herpetosiphonaceae bacterium]